MFQTSSLVLIAFFAALSAGAAIVSLALGARKKKHDDALWRRTEDKLLQRSIQLEDLKREFELVQRRLVLIEKASRVTTRVQEHEHIVRNAAANLVVADQPQLPMDRKVLVFWYFRTLSPEQIVYVRSMARSMGGAPLIDRLHDEIPWIFWQTSFNVGHDHPQRIVHDPQYAYLSGACELWSPDHEDEAWVWFLLKRAESMKLAAAPSSLP